MLFTAGGIKIKPTTHFEQRALERRFSRSFVLGLVSQAAPQLLGFQGQKLALDCGLAMIPVVCPRGDCIEVLTVLRRGQEFIRRDTLRVSISLQGAHHAH